MSLIQLYQKNPYLKLGDNKKNILISSNSYIIDKIKSNKPFIISRIGIGSETHSLLKYLKNDYSFNNGLIYTLSNNAGIYTNNIDEVIAFCKEYNARTSEQVGLIIPVKITVYEDKSYSFILKSPPASVLLAKYANVKKGASEPNKQNIGVVTLDQVKEIAEIKKADLNTSDIEKAILIIKGTAKNMGITVE